MVQDQCILLQIPFASTGIPYLLKSLTKIPIPAHRIPILIATVNRRKGKLVFCKSCLTHNFKSATTVLKGF